MSQKILIQLDTDAHPSSFDSVVAIDAGVDHLLPYHDVSAGNVTPIIHGAMFTRGGKNLANTAVFIGGSNVADAEELLESIKKAFFGPVRVSLMLDANGCNTTAAAAVVAADRHVEMRGARALVLGGTGPVGQRVAELLSRDGATVILTSRSQERAQAAADAVNARTESQEVSGAALANSNDAAEVAGEVDVIIGCGAAGVELISAEAIGQLSTLKVAIDLNAVPPAGIGGVEITDKAKPHEQTGALLYGAIGVGGLKMKTHRAAVESLFTSNDLVLDANEIYAIAKTIG